MFVLSVFNANHKQYKVATHDAVVDVTKSADSHSIYRHVYHRNYALKNNRDKY